jgi:hypothetical protein
MPLAGLVTSMSGRPPWGDAGGDAGHGAPTVPRNAAVAVVSKWVREAVSVSEWPSRTSMPCAR